MRIVKYKDQKLEEKKIYKLNYKNDTDETFIQIVKINYNSSTLDFIITTKERKVDEMLVKGCYTASGTIEIDKLKDFLENNTLSLCSNKTVERYFKSYKALLS